MKIQYVIKTKRGDAKRRMERAIEIAEDRTPISVRGVAYVLFNEVRKRHPRWSRMYM